MEISLKRRIVNAAESVKKKVKKIRDLDTDNKNALEMVFKPLTDPLNEIANSRHKKSDTDTGNNTSFDPSDTLKRKSTFDFSDYENDLMSKKNININSKYLSDNDDVSDCKRSYDDVRDNNSDDEENFDNEYSQNKPLFDSSLNDSFKTISTDKSENEDVSSWSLSPNSFKNVPYGVREERGKFRLGSHRVIINDKGFFIAGRHYNSTAGLKELLFKTVPNLPLVTECDKQNYKQMLIDTNAHRRDNDPKKPIKSNKGRKYLEVIRPLFKKVRNESDNSLPSGEGLPLMKTWRKNVDLVYWDDPNELVERLKLLIASRDAGNTGLDNEIISIIEELQEGGYINT